MSTYDRAAAQRRRAVSAQRSRWRRDPKPENVTAAGSLDLVGSSFVYLAFDRYNRLLYVGLTDALWTRLTAHLHRSAWWENAASVQWESFAARHEAAAREAELIRRLDPPFNRTQPWPLAAGAD